MSYLVKWELCLCPMMALASDQPAYMSGEAGSIEAAEASIVLSGLVDVVELHTFHGVDKQPFYVMAGTRERVAIRFIREPDPVYYKYGPGQARHRGRGEL